MSKNKIGGHRGRIPRYSEDEIQKYMNIIDTYKKSKRKKDIVESHSHELEPYMGQWLCVKCGVIKGYILGQYDINDFDRLYYQKKSIYHRKYYFEKKVNNISKLIGLNDKEKCELYEKLLEMDSSIMVKVNKKYNRKRMININFIIKKILKQIESRGVEGENPPREKYKKINIKISPKILEIYNNWWKVYKELIK